MTSTCGNEWITTIAHREWILGFADGALLTLFVVCIIIAVAVTALLAEVEP